MTAFVNTLAESLGSESRSSTSASLRPTSMDTALSLQLLEASDILGHDIRGSALRPAEESHRT